MTNQMGATLEVKPDVKLTFLTRFDNFLKVVKSQKLLPFSLSSRRNLTATSKFRKLGSKTQQHITKNFLFYLEFFSKLFSA